ncbi:agenet and bromo-adjacent homology domain-containing protein [Senna tora]|uniref:Agenet and bromo-adjacent homology domain-containing protein n=1 Tax=Senna tora TaxID=362788 RepID=A0A834TWM9_9FABA|nr:agenet and bromo-adjacent homology domain-containing protein [Senna tora]
MLKLKSRRDVVDWLNSVISDFAYSCLTRCSDFFPRFQDNQFRKVDNCSKEFSWSGYPWTCRKRRKHYQSFRWNGFKISVHDFVHVLAEEDKRLVAYLEDMYEDSRGNRMVMVRWFHKIDEVGIVLPHSFSDREIFFSLCLQDLSIECIDGLATVLSPQHYEKFQKEARHTLLEPFVCDNQVDNDDIKHFDITQVKGYWKQEILRYMYTLSDSKSNGSSQQSDDTPKLEEGSKFTSGIRPKKRLRWSKVDGSEGAAVDLENINNSGNETKSKSGNSSLNPAASTTTFTAGKETKENAVKSLVIGSQVEVLSQDSGIRGCWFIASIIKKHKDKVKVQYHDIQDAADESKKLEEWVLASRIAAPDHLNLRLNGRTKIRPAPQSNQCKASGLVNVGCIVDVWWNNGWWEGIVVQKDSEAKCHVYFPGEKLVSTFGLSDLRHSQEWTGVGWLNVSERPDLVSSILSSLKSSQDPTGKSAIRVSDGDDVKQSKQGDTSLNSERYHKSRKPELVPDLSKDDLLSQLKWNTSRKRRRSSSSGGSCRNSNSRKSPNASDPHAAGADNYMISASLKVVDHDDCKYSRGDPTIFSSSVVPSLTNLVMCR